MSKDSVAAFFKQVAEDGNLRQALVEFAARRGFRFTPGELCDVALNFLGRNNDAGSASAGSPEDRDDDSLDPGFGIIEYPA